MVKALDCSIIAREFELQSRYYVHFRTNTLEKDMNPLYPPIYGLDSSTTLLLKKRMDLELNNPRRVICHEIINNIWNHLTVCKRMR